MDGKPELPPLDMPSSTLRRWIPAAICSGKIFPSDVDNEPEGEMGVGTGVPGDEVESSPSSLTRRDRWMDSAKCSGMMPRPPTAAAWGNPKAAAAPWRPGVVEGVGG